MGARLVDGNRKTLASDMKIGQIGVIQGPPYDGTLLLRTYEGVVSLDNPGNTWGDQCSLPVVVLAKGSEVIVTAE